MIRFDLHAECIGNDGVPDSFFDLFKHGGQAVTEAAGHGRYLLDQGGLVDEQRVDEVSVIIIMYC